MCPGSACILYVSNGDEGAEVRSKKPCGEAQLTKANHDRHDSQAEMSKGGRLRLALIRILGGATVQTLLNCDNGYPPSKGRLSSLPSLIFLCLAGGGSEPGVMGLLAVDG